MGGKVTDLGGNVKDLVRKRENELQPEEKNLDEKQMRIQHA